MSRAKVQKRPDESNQPTNGPKIGPQPENRICPNRKSKLTGALALCWTIWTAVPLGCVAWDLVAGKLPGPVPDDHWIRAAAAYHRQRRADPCSDQLDWGHGSLRPCSSIKTSP